MSEDITKLDIAEEVVLEKFEGTPLPGDKPIEVIKIHKDGTVEHRFFPPPMDSSLAVNLGGLA